MGELTKIVIPVAGLGTRVLPASKVIPKEILPVVDKPVSQYVIGKIEYTLGEMAASPGPLEGWIIIFCIG